MPSWNLHVWEHVMLVSLALAAVAASAVGVATYKVVMLQRTEAEEAKLKVAEANERAADANSKAESERLERLKLEASLAPRSISPAQHADLVNALRPFAGKRVQVLSYSLDAEGMLLGHFLIEAMLAAGVRAEGLATVSPITHLFAGVHVTATPDQELAHGISKAIGETTSLTVTFAPQPPADEARAVLGGLAQNKPPAELLVGIKPMPKQPK